MQIRAFSFFNSNNDEDFKARYLVPVFGEDKASEAMMMIKYLAFCYCNPKFKERIVETDERGREVITYMLDEKKINFMCDFIDGTAYITVIQ